MGRDLRSAANFYCCTRERVRGTTAKKKTRSLFVIVTIVRSCMSEMDFTGLFCACNQAISLGQCGMGESESYDPMALAAEVQGIESRPLKQKPLVSQTCKNQASVVPRAACNLMFLHAACGQGFSVKGLMAARKKILNSLTKSTRLVLADCESGGLSCGQ